MANTLEKQGNEELKIKNAPQSEEALLSQAQSTAKANFDILTNTKTEQDKKVQEAQVATASITELSRNGVAFIESAKGSAREFVLASSKYPKLLENINNISEKQKSELLQDLGYNILDKVLYGTEYEALEALLKKRIEKETIVRAREMFNEELTKRENAAKAAQAEAQKATEKTAQVKAVYEADQQNAITLAEKIKGNYGMKKLEAAGKKAMSNEKIAQLGQVVAYSHDTNVNYENNPNYLTSDKESFLKDYLAGIDTDLQKLGEETTTIGFMNELRKKYTQLQGFSVAYMGSTDYEKIQGVLNGEKNSVQKRLSAHGEIAKMKNDNLLTKQQAESDMTVEQKVIAQADEMTNTCNGKMAMCDENIAVARQRDNAPLMLALNANTVAAGYGNVDMVAAANMANANKNT